VLVSTEPLFISTDFEKEFRKKKDKEEYSNFVEEL